MMSEVTAARREYAASVKERPRREVADDDVDAVASPDAGTDGDDPDATRSVQDLIAAALKMFSPPEPAPDAATTTAPAAPAIGLPAAASIEAAVQQVLDQISVALAKPVEPEAIGKEDEASSDKDRMADSALEALPDGAILVEPELQTDAPMTAKGPVATTAVRDPAPLPENPNPSHVHLVIDDGAERVVVTVAVRGNEVSTTFRGGDEQTAAALARNAASLDHALRAGGLDLAGFSSERDLDHHAPREQRGREQDPAYPDEEQA